MSFFQAFGRILPIGVGIFAAVKGHSWYLSRTPHSTPCPRFEMQQDAIKLKENALKFLDRPYFLDGSILDPTTSYAFTSGINGI
ncbi:hypothetical protein HDU79_006927 [Rhizoclosmatium sp. JEL0117]|nr:hypothetical protein HDU79_006927 [Rhizoclosmatium sp. JEL0117]